jgi:hypothetical protein
MNEIVPTGQAAIDARAEAAKARAETAAAHLELQRQADAAKAELAAQRAAMEAEFRAKMAEIEAAAAPVKAELNRLTEVGKTIDLYLGRDEDVALLRGGKPAPADTPLVIRSTVLVCRRGIAGSESTLTGASTSGRWATSWTGWWPLRRTWTGSRRTSGASWWSSRLARVATTATLG